MADSYEMASRGRPTISIFSSSSESSASSWLPGWATRGRYSALPSSGSPDGYAGRSAPSRRRLIQIGVGSAFALAVVALGSMRGAGSDMSQYAQDLPLRVGESGDVEDSTVSAQWGMTEEQGWTEESIQGLVDLGDTAEEQYRLGITPDEDGAALYFRQLYDFAIKLDPSIASPLLYNLYQHLPSNLNGLFDEPERPHIGPPSMISYKTIHQTDKTSEINSMTRQWVSMNEKDGWSLNFLDDDAAWEWVQSKFPGTDVEWAWSYMHRGVLRADFLRYLLPLLEGGVYSDTDTFPIRPIERWGLINVEYLDLSGTDGPDWKSKLATHPAVIVSIDVNVHAKMDWWQQWPRALGICQWTLSSSPYHPIYLDAVRRVVNATRVVEAWEMDRAAEISRLQLEQPPGYEKQISQLESKGRDQAMHVLEWTGPGLFTDAVMGFLLARYHVTWHRFRGLDHPLRIGDVLVLPITGFSPGGEKDFGAEGSDSPQANVIHNFRGSWKSDGQ